MKNAVSVVGLPLEIITLGRNPACFLNEPNQPTQPRAEMRRQTCSDPWPRHADRTAPLNPVFRTFLLG